MWITLGIMGLLSRIKTIILLLLFVFIQKVQAQYYANPNPYDTCKLIRVGIIPYQLFGRSAGMYFSIKKPNSYWEYRPTYTFAFTKNHSVPYILDLDYDTYHYHGINNNFILKFNDSRNVHTRLLLIQRTWWYNNNRIPADNVVSSKQQTLYINQSALINGLGFGLDFYWDFSDGDLDRNFFITLSGSYLYGKRHLNYNSQYFKNEVVEVNKIVLNFTIGFEFGSRSKINKN